MPNFAITKTTVYDVDEKGEIVPREINDKFPINSNGPRTGQGTLAEQTKRRQDELVGQSQRSYSEAVKKSTDIKINKLQSTYEKRLEDVTSRENTYNSLADQIAKLGGGGGGGTQYAGGTPNFDETTGQYRQAIGSLGADRNYGASDLSTKLNFQVSDDQILNDFNTTKINRLNNVVTSGNTQIAGIQDRLATAQTLLDQFPANDPRRTGSDVYIKQLKSDLASVTSAVKDASTQIANFKPAQLGSPEALQQITSFREYIQLPEEKASQQLRQIDPEAYKTAIGLGRQYRQMATQPLGETTTPQTEQLRNTVEQEALNQLRLGSTIGAEERRGYEQAVRSAQSARGNIFGLGPAVQEAAQLGAAGEQRKLARYGAAAQFLGSGETTGAATARDLALRQSLQQSRLGAAAGFIAGGPSIGNLAQQRLAQQNQASMQYIQANQALPGSFQSQGMPNQFYQTTNPAIPVQLASNAANIYGSMSDYLSSTYGAQVGAISRQPSGAEMFGQIATGLGNLVKI